MSSKTYPDILNCQLWTKYNGDIWQISVDIYKPKPIVQNGNPNVQVNWEISHFSNQSTGKMYAAETDVNLTEELNDHLSNLKSFDPEGMYYQFAKQY